jgi:cyclophilin family peptidyl-prolyl cis-trans isomerase
VNLHYKSCNLHRIVPDFVLQMGDVTNGDGSGGKNHNKTSCLKEAFENYYK